MKLFQILDYAETGDYKIYWAPSLQAANIITGKLFASGSKVVEVEPYIFPTTKAGIINWLNLYVKTGKTTP